MLNYIAFYYREWKKIEKKSIAEASQKLFVMIKVVKKIILKIIQKQEQQLSSFKRKRKLEE